MKVAISVASDERVSERRRQRICLRIPKQEPTIEFAYVHVYKLTVQSSARHISPVPVYITMSCSSPPKTTGT